MARIYFSKDINQLLEKEFGSDFGSDTVVTYHTMYGKPEVRAGQVLEWQKYKAVHDTLESSRIVLIGLNRMITPSNRCDFIHAYLAVMTPQISKVIIDTAPFIGEPWRLYYHYQVANCFSKFGANYSYPIEGEWLKWFSRDLDECQFSPHNLRERIVETYSDLPRLNTTFEFYEVSKDDKEWYAEARKFEFGRFRAPKTLLMNLTKAANSHFGIKISYDSYLRNEAIRVPDIGIYRFMIEENRRRRDIYNLFTEI
jgi:hypothetical protein